MKRLHLDLSAEVSDALQRESEARGVSPEAFAIEILEWLLDDGPPRELNSFTAPVLAELWDNDEDAAYDVL